MLRLGILQELSLFKQIFSSDDNVGNQTIQTVRNQLQQLQTTQQYLQQVPNIYDALKRIPSEQRNATIDSLMQQVSAGTTPQPNPIQVKSYMFDAITRIEKGNL